MTSRADSLACSCGSESFQRVVVRRLDGTSFVTEFMSCVACHAMFHAGPDPSIDRERHRRLMADVFQAAKAYRKPGRR